MVSEHKEEENKEEAIPSRRGFLEASAALAAGTLLGAAKGEPMLAAVQKDRADLPTQNYHGIGLERKNQVATIRLGTSQSPAAGSRPSYNGHWELANLFSDLRADNSIRVIVITGSKDGVFGLAPRAEWHTPEMIKKGLTDPSEAWKTFTGVVRIHEAMTAMEKVIVARVNGHAVGGSSNLMWASDIIVAREDAVIADHHLGGPVKVPGVDSLVGTP